MDGRAVTTAEEAEGLQVPARVIPVPSSVSSEQQAMLAVAPATASAVFYPSHDDHDGWRQFAAAIDEVMLTSLERINGTSARVELAEVAGADVYKIWPSTYKKGDARVCLDIHGGGLICGGGECSRGIGIFDGTRFGMHTWAVDYRMPPDHPFPAGLDDCVAVYRELLEQRDPSQIVVAGTSAGANLAAALILRARDEGLPLPAAAILLTPELDLTESGDSFRTNLGIDTVLTESLMPQNRLYAGDHDLADPYLSPLFGDFSLGFPPTLLESGTRDLFLSNAVRMHRALRAAQVPTELHVMEAAPHGLQHGTPEDDGLQRDVRQFIRIHCPA